MRLQFNDEELRFMSDEVFPCLQQDSRVRANIRGDIIRLTDCTSNPPGMVQGIGVMEDGDTQ